jgi:hypothetical protein
LGSSEIIEWINQIIEVLKPLGVNEFHHDIYGRLVGKCIPKEIRKKLASYYTKIPSAELLVGLTIQNWEETVWDLACGSGTLLVAAYNKKKSLFREKRGSLPIGESIELHKRFLEKDLTGTDVMRFACHLSGLNLSAQNLKTVTNHLRISRVNTLFIDNLPAELEEAYGSISRRLSEIETVQKTLSKYGQEGLIEEEEDIKKIKLSRVNTVLINPPFTRRKNIPDSLKEKLRGSKYENICGGRIHLWGYFLAFADNAIKDGGKLGAIIPMNFLRGEDTQKIREYILNNYTIEYIVKPLDNTSFSEDSDYGDIILVASKKEPSEEHKTNIICLKEEISETSNTNIEALLSKISTAILEIQDNDEYLLRKINQKELQKSANNLMPYLFSSNLTALQAFEKIYCQMQNSNRFRRIEKSELHDGIQLRPTGTANDRLITRKISPSRVTRSKKYFENDNSESYIKYLDKEEGEKKILKKEIVKTLRTPVSLNSIDVTEKHDFFIKKNYNITKTSHLHISTRLRINSDNTHSLAFYHNDKITSYNTFTMFLNLDKDSAKFLALFFNSIFYLLQLYAFKKQTTRSYEGIRQKDFTQMYIPKIENFKQDVKAIVEKCFKNYYDLPSIKQQLEEKNELRVQLDLKLSQILGLEITEGELKELYRLVLDGLKD